MVQVSQLAVPQVTPLVPGLDRIAYGGDYNPEQWPEEVWAEDVALMREAGVNLVSVGIFSWAMLEPTPGRYEFGWLDRLLDLLHAHGIAVDLATPTAAPPPWFLRRFPAARPMTRSSTPLGGGARQTFCPSSPDYAAAAAAITTELGRRYGSHPAVLLWHAHNEYGGANGICYCPASGAAFRSWLADRYGSLDALNAAWGTTFWSQRYSDWDEIEPPTEAPTAVNPAQELDYYRFSSDAHLANFRRERDILHALSPGVPVTTNFMLANCKNIDYWRWAAEVDVVSNDHYLQAERPDNHIELAMCADLTRSVAGGAPWLLMEHSTGAVNWQPRNLAKRPGELIRNSLAHLARGADGIMFFQWRASRYGAEKFHSAMLPHGGTDTRIWRDVVSLGTSLGALDAVRGTPVAADAAIIWDWESWWALELPWRPSAELAFRERQEAFYEALWRRHLTVDFARPSAPLAAYPVVFLPAGYLLTAAAAAGLRDYVAGGGTLVVSYFSGIVDEHDAVHPGPHPGALRDVLGLRVEEFLPLREGETTALSTGVSGDVWAERLLLDGATEIASYLDGPAAGLPAITSHAYGAGRAFYVSTRLRAEALDAFVASLGLPERDLPAGVEVVRRGDFVIALNHTESDATVPGSGVELLTGEPCADGVVVPAGAVRVLRTTP
ncbi:beta-galactosidase [Catenuloplanes atrovinosus]|uniref:Beta-galactosidase n=1 Tax=Catenuloplanes atrovinosus TaxID=137266 RepID=A0AAE4C988_9ACTN|nr:beta-galactosidase [Catenuloplanes atrovinosus]MDR7273360.1 beta-galactosidase [Catenuloplanes atrovinosus]